jgi:Arc/MetJ family transcription regulator
MNLPICMRTTLDLDDDLIKAAKRYAAANDRTLTNVIEEALRESLYAKRAGKNQRRFEFKWRTVKGRVRAGVDITDRDSLLDLMEGRR